MRSKATIQKSHSIYRGCAIGWKHICYTDSLFKSDFLGVSRILFPLGRQLYPAWCLDAFTYQGILPLWEMLRLTKQLPMQNKKTYSTGNTFPLLCTELKIFCYINSPFKRDFLYLPGIRFLRGMETRYMFNIRIHCMSSILQIFFH